MVDSLALIEVLLGAQPVSSLSHLIAAGAALAAALPLVRLGRGCSVRTIALGVYALCVVIALFISGVYHSLLPGDSIRHTMQRLDYYGIWLLIAGTFTAVHGIMCRGFWREGLLAIVWGYAATGIVLQVLWFETFKGGVGLALYLGLGWLGVFSMLKLGQQIGYRKVLPVLYAGLAFSIGAVLEKIGWPVLVANWIEPHEVFHFAVVLGVSLMWLFIRRLVLHHAPPLQPPAAARATVE